jgi:hypothetical protein
MLMNVKEHEMHRGQLMLIERMMGIIPHLTSQMENQIAAAQTARGEDFQSSNNVRRPE